MAETGSETRRHSGHKIVTSISYCCCSILYSKYGYEKTLVIPIHLENRFEALMNVGEESPNVTKHGSNQPAANIATNRRSRSTRQRHSAQSASEPRTLIVGDSIIRKISSRTTTCCFPQATVSDVNKELRNILMKHKTANQIIIHVGKNDIQKEQS